MKFQAETCQSLYRLITFITLPFSYFSPNSPMHDFEHEPVHDLFQQWRMVKETLRNMVGETAPSYLD